MSDDKKDFEPTMNDKIQSCGLTIVLVGAVALAFFTGGKTFDPRIIIPYIFIGVAAWMAISMLVYSLSLKNIIQLPAGILLCYGIFAFVFPSVARNIAPAEWEWPVAGQVQALVLPDGRRAAVTEGSGRVQVYDSAGQYLTGWFLPDEFVEILGTGPDNNLESGPDTILVDVRRERLLTLYDAEGHIIRQDPRPEHYKAVPKGHFEERSFKSPWYKWPLGHPGRGWMIAAAGMAGMALSVFLTNKLDKDKKAGKETDGRSLDARANPRPTPVILAEDKAKWDEGRRNRLICLGLIALAVIFLAWGIYNHWGGNTGSLSTLAIPLAWSLVVGLGSYKALKDSGAFSGHDPLIFKKIIILGLSAFLCIYSVCAFVIPGFTAKNFIPGNWEWPMPGQSQALLLPSGKRAVRQLSAHRLQIYGPDGQYLNGWYLDNGFTILGPGQGPDVPEGLETIEVQFSAQKILFDLDGNILHQQELPDYSPLPLTGQFIEMSFHSPFYLWPLANPLRAWIMGAVSLVLFGIAQSLVRAMGTSESDKGLHPTRR